MTKEDIEPLASPREHEPAEATFTFIRENDGTTNMSFKNIGFNHVELIGLLHIATEGVSQRSLELAKRIKTKKQKQENQNEILEAAKEDLLQNLLMQIETCREDPSNIDWPPVLDSWKIRIANILEKEE